MNDTNAKQQIVERIKKSSNILVAVSSDPSVDELSAALGLTVLLNKMDKHATAVFSGAIPPAITFLDPQKTFESTVDSLRDFIIALDKEKADHLRYKVDGDVVKIFITPYRTTITSDDLDFSQGDYNVELVLALGVNNKDHLDTALAAHGRILHDATVATISASAERSDLGSIEWSDAGASSLSEMLVGLVDALKLDKTMLDEQVATAFMTGIVSATERFSNNRTSSKVMTVAAQLMAAGANQQLIALKLGESGETADEANDETTTDETDHADGTTDLAEGASTKLGKTKKARKRPAAEAEATPEEAEPPKRQDGDLEISHDNSAALEEAAREAEATAQREAAAAAEAELAREQQEKAASVASDADQALAEQLAATVPPTAPVVSDISETDLEADEPTMGGTLNATTEQAAEESRREQLSSRNHTILSHPGEYIGDQTPSFQSPINAAADASEEEGQPDLFQASSAPVAGTTLRAAPIEPPREEPAVQPAPLAPPLSEPVAPAAPAPEPTLAELDAQVRTPQEHDEARAAVAAAFGAVHYEPAPIPTAQPEPQVAAPEQSIEPPLPPMPPMPDFSTLPPSQPPAFGSGDDQQLPPPPPTPPTTDPGQFRIPGQ